MSRINLFKTILSDQFNRWARALICRDEIGMVEYQYWLDHNQRHTSQGHIERIVLMDLINEKGGNNDVFRAQRWFIDSDKKAISEPENLVVKICKPYAPAGPGLHHRLSMIQGAFFDEVRINNLVRSTNIEGVVRSRGGRRAGRLTLLLLDFVQGDTLFKQMKKNLSEKEFFERLARMAYVANTISQLHYYGVVHMDLKPKNLILCQEENKAQTDKILIMDFGFASARLRDAAGQAQAQLSPVYAAPEQALLSNKLLTPAVDYFSFGVILHEYLTGEHLFPQAQSIFDANGGFITDEYMQHLKNGRVNALRDLTRFSDSVYQILAQHIDDLTTFDSTMRRQKCKNLFDIAHELKDMAKAKGVQSKSIEFLDTQLEEYKTLYGPRLGRT